MCPNWVSWVPGWQRAVCVHMLWGLGACSAGMGEGLRGGRGHMASGGDGEALPEPSWEEVCGTVCWASNTRRRQQALTRPLVPEDGAPDVSGSWRTQGEHCWSRRMPSPLPSSSDSEGSAGLSFLNLGVCVTSGPFPVLQGGYPGGKRGPEGVPRTSGLWIPWPGGLRPWNTWYFGGKCSPVCAQPLTCCFHHPTPMYTPCLLCRYTCPFDTHLPCHWLYVSQPPP